MVAQWLLHALKGRVCAPSWEVEGSIPPVAVIIRLHPWLCRGTATELPIWGKRSVKRQFRGQGQWTYSKPLEVQRGCVMCCWWSSTVGSLWVDSIPNELTGLAQFPEAVSFADWWLSTMRSPWVDSIPNKLVGQAQFLACKGPKG